MNYNFVILVSWLQNAKKYDALQLIGMTDKQDDSKMRKRDITTNMWSTYNTLDKLYNKHRAVYPSSDFTEIL